ncbi:sulfite exporter TauE/SafE family protein [Nocardioides sp. R1-1]|uniref:sulfite exporter TauE/SafE family protein n=1 Tax=Nocardioides sp. R1-1 TaxID=3383502 RepID=UPI0038D25881
MTELEQLAVLGAGFGAGILTSTVGVASLLSFPVLVALGIPPVVANASNTVGLIPAGLSGSFGYREELREHPGVTRVVLVCCALGAVGGAILLLALPAAAFEAAVPWLILLACGLVGAQPWISRWLARHRDLGDGPRHALSPATTGFALLTGVYGGYFGAGSGVMMVAVLALGTDLDLRVVNGLKTLAVMAGNIVAGAIFVAVADLDWHAIALLAAGSVGGGYLGARIGRRLPSSVFRAGVVVAGLVAAALMLR